MPEDREKQAQQKDVLRKAIDTLHRDMRRLFLEYQVLRGQGREDEAQTKIRERSAKEGDVARLQLALTDLEDSESTDAKPVLNGLVQEALTQFEQSRKERDIAQSARLAAADDKKEAFEAKAEAAVDREVAVESADRTLTEIVGFAEEENRLAGKALFAVPAGIAFADSWILYKGATAVKMSPAAHTAVVISLGIAIFAALVPSLYHALSARRIADAAEGESNKGALTALQAEAAFRASRRALIKNRIWWFASAILICVASLAFLMSALVTSVSP